MSTPPVTGPLIPGEPKNRAGLDFRAYLDQKIGIHREVLNHLNLEQVATQPDDHVRRQVYAAIQGVAANLKTPPSAPELTPTEKEQLLFGFWKRSSVWGRSNRCSRIRPSATSW
jgi:hypothetical protein